MRRVYDDVYSFTTCITFQRYLYMHKTRLIPTTLLLDIKEMLHRTLFRECLTGDIKQTSASP